MTIHYTDDAVTLWHGDCRLVLAELPDESVDAVVTDPPYELGFMGRRWDATGIAYNVALWRDVLRVLKPGAHLLAFGGTRTWHRLACAIEDAGFEVRDNVAYLHDGGLPGPMCWAFGSGFPKSHNVSKALQGKRCECDAIDWLYEAVPAENVRGVRPAVDADDALPSDAEPDLLEGLRQSVAVPVHDGPTGLEQVGPVDLPGLRQDVSPLTDEAPRGSSSDVLPPVSGSAVSGRAGSAVGHSVGGTEDEQAGLPRGQEPRMEGRRDVQAPEGELRRATLRPMPAGVPGDGASGRLRHGAPASDGAQAGPRAAADRSGEPHQPRPEGQQAGEPGVVPEQRGSQAWGGWPVCARCGKPSIPDGLGTALKPAFEPVVVARKPLVGTVAANVLQHGTGAINVDGCRVEHDEPEGKPAVGMHGKRAGIMGETVERYRATTSASTAGRWPANVILDESQAAELDRQSGEASYNPPATWKGGTGTTEGWGNVGKAEPGEVRSGFGDRGGASRFFYTAKADSSERPRVDGVAHPTVKPLDLMRYLVRLVTPPGGVVLEPFAGSGTTLEACIVEGFRCIGIEREADYIPLIMARITKPIEVTLL